MKKTKQQLEDELRNLEEKYMQDMEYIQLFINGISHNNFHQGFLRELFSGGRIDMRKATNDIMRFISMNKYKWEIQMGNTMRERKNNGNI